MIATATESTSRSSGSQKRRYGLGLLALAAVMSAGTAALRSSPDVASGNAPASIAMAVTRVSALGTLEPASRIVRLSAPTAPEGARIDQLFVAEGDWVESGAVVAILDTSGRRQTALQEAETRVALARTRLEHVKAGSKAGEIAARAADVARAEAALQNAENEFGRAKQLHSKQAISPEDFDRRRYQYDSAGHEVARAKGMLDSSREVRDVDVHQARAEVDAALAGVARAQADLDATQVRAPFAGRILKVVARPGERISDGGLVELGDTSEMHAVAEVYEADLPRVCLGQPARVRVPSCDVQLRGEVVSLGQRVARKIVFDNDPVADTDARVVEVRVRIAADEGQRVAGLSNARVHVVIDTSRGE
jgi:HlyD family secretion protein